MLGFLAAGQPGEVEGRLRRFDGVFIDGSCFGLSVSRRYRATLSTGMERIRTSMTFKRAEAKLRKDEEELRRMTDAIPQTIIVLNPEGEPFMQIAWRLSNNRTVSGRRANRQFLGARFPSRRRVQRLREETLQALSDTAPSKTRNGL